MSNAGMNTFCPLKCEEHVKVAYMYLVPIQTIIVKGAKPTKVFDSTQVVEDVVKSWVGLLTCLGNQIQAYAAQTLQLEQKQV